MDNEFFTLEKYEMSIMTLKPENKMNTTNEPQTLFVKYALWMDGEHKTSQNHLYSYVEHQTKITKEMIINYYNAS